MVTNTVVLAPWSRRAQTTQCSEAQRLLEGLAVGRGRLLPVNVPGGGSLLATQREGGKDDHDAM